MDGTIKSIREWADDWHHGPWSVAQLPEVINAKVRYIPHWGRFFGTSFTDASGKSSICINQDLVDTDRYVLALAHEVGHILLRHTGMHPCMPQIHTQSRSEQRAWRAAALLAVPTRAIEMVARGNAFPIDVAREYSVPLPLVELRYAQLQSLGTPCITYSMRITQTDRFIQWLSEEGPPRAT